MLITSGKDKERFLFHCDFGFIIVEALEVIDFWLSKDEGFSLDCSLFERDPASHVFDMLNNEVDWDAIVSEARNDDVCVDDRR